MSKMAQMKAIIHAKLIINDEVIEGKILLFDEKIIDIVDTVPKGLSEIIDAQGQYVSPGFIDMHIHGAGGADVMDASPEALETISTTLVKTGTTSFLATTMTMSKEAIDNALRNIQKHAPDVTGAQIAGVHLEGPFINPEKQGAQDAAYIQTANMATIAAYMDEVKMITLAPEIEQNQPFMEKMAKAYPEVVLSLGHSNASYDESKASFAKGISHVTHLFNAMTPYHHRDPGVVGAVFDSDVSCDIIADLIHVHPSVLDLTWKQKKEKLILITDAMRAGCMKQGLYDLGGQEVEVVKGKATLKDGTLAGSVLRMNDALKNMLQYTDMSRVDAVNAVTKYPAVKLGLKKGELKAGYDADIVMFDEDFSIITTIVAGHIKYRRK